METVSEKLYDELDDSLSDARELHSAILLLTHQMEATLDRPGEKQPNGNRLLSMPPELIDSLMWLVGTIYAKSKGLQEGLSSTFDAVEAEEPVAQKLAKAA